MPILGSRCLPAPRRVRDTPLLRSVSLSCFRGATPRDPSLKVSFGDADYYIHVVAPKAELWPLGSKKRQRVQHPSRAPTAELEKQARESASRLAARLKLPSQTPACGSTSKRWWPFRLLMDTGSGDHLASKGTTPSAILRCASKTDSPLLLTTANGLIDADTQVPFYVQRLDIDLAALLLDSTPEVLSVGRLVEEHVLLRLGSRIQALPPRPERACDLAVIREFLSLFGPRA